MKGPCDEHPITDWGVTEPPNTEALRERITEVAGSTATTELWCEAAQTLLYDCRAALDAIASELERLRDDLRMATPERLWKQRVRAERDEAYENGYNRAADDVTNKMQARLNRAVEALREIDAKPYRAEEVVARWKAEIEESG